MKRRLYLQIYVAFLGVAALCVGLAAGAARLMWSGGPEVPEPARGAAEWAVGNLPDPADPAFSAQLQELGQRLSMDLALWSPTGQLLGAAGQPLPADLRACSREGWFHADGAAGMLVRLSDGRCLAAATQVHGPPAPLRHLPAGLVFPLVFAAMAAGCYPVARRITRRLEALQRGVERWGQGDLSARVEVTGQDEVAELATSFNRAASDVAALMEAQRRVLANASHELRSPLARLRMALALLDEDDAPAERQAVLDEANRDIEELDALIGDVLLAARLESGRAAPRREPVDLRALLDEEGARVGVSARGPAVTLTGDPTLLRRMVRNLLENALHHGAPPVELSVAPVGGGWEVAVADRGPGVPPEDAARIFEPFFRRAGHSEGADGGVGLGLALVRQIALAHGGQAVTAPREGGGSVFTVWLPAN